MPSQIKPLTLNFLSMSKAWVSKVQPSKESLVVQGQMKTELCVMSQTFWGLWLKVQQLATH